MTQLDDYYDEPECEDDEELFWRREFADPGGESALRAETPDNPRDRPCPSCGRENVLTRKDVELHYQCDRCAERDEGGGF
jgi:hypothetical protein